MLIPASADKSLWPLIELLCLVFFILFNAHSRIDFSPDAGIHRIDTTGVQRRKTWALPDPAALVDKLYGSC